MTLFRHTGRGTEWTRLVEEIVPDFVDRVTGGPLPGKEEAWDLVTQYRVWLAQEARRLDEAYRLQGVRVDRNRQRAATILAKQPQGWDAKEKETMRTLGSSLSMLSEILREQGSAKCVDGYREAISLAESSHYLPGAATCMFQLGLAYEGLPEIRDLAVAERWYQRSFELTPRDDHMGRAKRLGALGSLAEQRLHDEIKSDCPLKECLVAYLSKAEQYYKHALDMLPSNALRELATTHNQLGNVYNNAGQTDTALHYYRESVRYKEAMQDRFAAGRTRLNAAIALTQVGRFHDARDWAQSALRDYQACDSADQEIVNTLKLLEQIESDLRATSPPSSAHPPRPR